MKDNCFATSFFNFVSDHKTITLRIGLEKNKFRSDFLEKITFDKESHLKSRSCHEEVFINSIESDESTSYSDTVDQIEDSGDFTRRFLNADNSTCWLNSCLQLILAALDRVEDDEFFTSNLGVELINLRENNLKSLDPQQVKAIIIEAEDIRVASRLSEIASSVMFQSLKDKQTRLALNQRFNFSEGQQCARDLFMCLQTNAGFWPEVCATFEFDLSHSTVCISCNHMHSLESSQMFIEIPVPDSGTNLNTAIEEFFNQSNLVEKNCEDGCKKTY